MAKKIRTVLTLQLPAGKATPAPPVGTALGPHGINIVEFTKSYNEKTAAQSGQIIPARITIYEDRSFTFILKTPPAADLLRKAAGVEKGSGAAGREENVGSVTRAQLLEIAEIKKADLNADDPEMAARVIAGTARSMGIEVVD
ncbi:MAG: 50S ribosomal protein L11 [Chloroflexota bacterium]|jgi:large subunit ribosomal protein L11